MTKSCWNQVGVMGDRTCPELKTFIHCHNCPVYTTAGRRLLERESPLEYRDEWTHFFATEESKVKGDRRKDEEVSIGAETLENSNIVSVLVFRLGVEWFALPTKFFREVRLPTGIHRVPHRSNEIFLGLANVGGELLLCVSLQSLLGLETTIDPPMKHPVNHSSGSPVVYRRAIAIEQERHSWFFEVDEIHGIDRVNLDNSRKVPAVNSQSNTVYTQAIFQWDERSVNLLDAELLFYTLERIIL